MGNTLKPNLDLEINSLKPFRVTDTDKKSYYCIIGQRLSIYLFRAPPHGHQILPFLLPLSEPLAELAQLLRKEWFCHIYLAFVARKGTMHEQKQVILSIKREYKTFDDISTKIA